MSKKFSLDDEVVVIVGSGAGGGTLGNEFAQKGIDVVILEAGGRHEINDFENDEWPMFSKISWLDKRTTSGTWRVSNDFPNLPAWIVKAVGGSPCTGRALPCAFRSTSSKHARCTVKWAALTCSTGQSRWMS